MTGSANGYFQLYAVLLDKPTAATASAPNRQTITWSVTLNPIWKTDSKLTGIASRRIFPGSPCGLTSCSEGPEDGRSRVGMAKEGFLTERPILGAAGLQFIRRIPLIWTSYRPRRAQGYSRLQTSGLLSFSRAVCLGAQLAPVLLQALPMPLRWPGSRSSWAVWRSRPSSRLLPSALRSPCRQRCACCCVSWSSVSPFSNRSSKRCVRLSLALRCSRSSALFGTPAADFPL